MLRKSYEPMKLQTSLPISHDYTEICKSCLEKVLKNLKKIYQLLAPNTLSNEVRQIMEI